jgi:hypothetical protein
MTSHTTAAAAAAAAGGLAPLRPEQAAGAYGPYLTEQVREGALQGKRGGGGG